MMTPVTLSKMVFVFVDSGVDEFVFVDSGVDEGRREVGRTG